MGIEMQAEAKTTQTEGAGLDETIMKGGSRNGRGRMSDSVKTNATTRLQVLQSTLAEKMPGEKKGGDTTKQIIRSRQIVD